ncbi:MAG: DUF2721 domain-containing protein [Gemmataceae bacterium]|nr:DUF2721 domain-containing protein [Gemmataceae bacterium]
MLAALLFADAPADGARAIQLALAPVFLLTAIAGILNVMTGRLSRIVDRGRKLAEGPPGSLNLEPSAQAKELRSLERRRHYASAAITAGTLSALLVCLVIVMLFAEVLLDLPIKWLEGITFTAATLALVVGLSYFLREVHLATRTIRFHVAPTPRADE